MLVVVGGDAVDEGSGCVDGGHGWDAEGDSFAAEDNGVALWVAAFLGGGDDVVDAAAFDEVGSVEAFAFVDLVELDDVDVWICGFDGVGSAFGCVDFEAW